MQLPNFFEAMKLSSTLIWVWGIIKTFKESSNYTLIVVPIVFYLWTTTFKDLQAQLFSLELLYQILRVWLRNFSQVRVCYVNIMLNFNDAGVPGKWILKVSGNRCNKPYLSPIWLGTFLSFITLSSEVICVCDYRMHFDEKRVLKYPWSKLIWWRKV